MKIPVIWLLLFCILFHLLQTLHCISGHGHTEPQLPPIKDQTAILSPTTHTDGSSQSRQMFTDCKMLHSSLEAFIIWICVFPLILPTSKSCSTKEWLMVTITLHCVHGRCMISFFRVMSSYVPKNTLIYFENIPLTGPGSLATWRHFSAQALVLNCTNPVPEYAQNSYTLACMYTIILSSLLTVEKS